MNQLRESESVNDILLELFADADSALSFDCADPRANFAQMGWFVLPKGTLAKSIEVEHGA